MPFIRRHIPGLILAVTLCMAASGCTGLNRPEPAELPGDLPTQWSSVAGAVEPGGNPPQQQAAAGQVRIKDLAVTTSLLDLFNDDGMAALVRQALDHNPDLKATAARLRASGFLLSQTGSRRLPQVSAGADQGRNNQYTDETGAPDTKNHTQISASISWELDLWGRISDRNHSQVLEHKALALEYTRTYDALAARVIQAWINGVAVRQALGIEKERLAALQKIESILLLKYRQGLGSLEEFSAARTRTQVARSNVHARKRFYNSALRTLDILAGRYPGAGKALGKNLPQIRRAPILPPGAALKNRPDIQAALARINAGHLAALAARKDRLPALRLVAEVSKSATSLSQLDTASRIWSLAAGLTQPVFQGGRLKDQALARQAEADAAVYDLARAVLAAMKEVEDALDKETALAAREQALTIAVLEATRTTRYFLDRYRKGLDNIQTLLNAQEQEMNIKTSLTDIRAARMANRIDTALAMGLGVPEPHSNSRMNQK